jgi:hypothetical protein
VIRRRLLVAATVVLACARPYPPPGGEQIRTPPLIVATTPEPLSTVQPTSDPVTFRFDRTISEQGVTDASALISPATGEARVERKGDRLEIRAEGGWLEGIVYRVVLMPGLRDRFGNESREPAVLVFSTGPEIPPAAIAGLALDRITGRPAEDVVVQARSRADSLLYQTVPDTGGFFAVQHLMPASYDLRAFQDRNRNREVDLGEPASRSTVITVNRATDTLTTLLAVVPWDTVAARVQSAQARDSLEIRVTTDDYLEQETLRNVDVSIVTLPDSIPVDGEMRIMAPAAFDSLRAVQDSINAARDSLLAPPDTLPADTAAVDTLVAPPQLPITPPRTVVRQPGAEPEIPLPIREFVVIPAAPLAPGGTYEIRVRGLLNISGVARGGGSAEFTVPERPDTTGVGARPPDAGR